MLGAVRLGRGLGSPQPLLLTTSTEWAVLAHTEEARGPGALLETEGPRAVPAAASRGQGLGQVAGRATISFRSGHQQPRPLRCPALTPAGSSAHPAAGSRSVAWAENWESKSMKSGGLRQSRFNR